MLVPSFGNEWRMAMLLVFQAAHAPRCLSESSNPLLRNAFRVAQTTPPFVTLISSEYFQTSGQ